MKNNPSKVGKFKVIVKNSQINKLVLINKLTM